MFKVKKQGSQTWGVYHNNTLIEGGFFSFYAAEQNAYERTQQQEFDGMADQVDRHEAEYGS